jgi:hypothetical protein
MPRTTLPIRLVLSGKGEHSCVEILSTQEINALKEKYRPPLTAQERAEKQEREANRPDTSHLTVWDPSRR